MSNQTTRPEELNELQMLEKVAATAAAHAQVMNLPDEQRRAYLAGAEAGATLLAVYIRDSVRPRVDRATGKTYRALTWQS